MCVCVRERGGRREKVIACVCEREEVTACMCEKERGSDCVCVREREREGGIKEVTAWVCV